MNSLSSQQVLIMVRFLPLHVSASSQYGYLREGHKFVKFGSLLLLLLFSLFVRQQFFPSLNAYEWEDGHAINIQKQNTFIYKVH